MQTKLEEIENKLDTLDHAYFHTYITNTADGKIEWKIFYKNLSNEDYLSHRNRPLLTSKQYAIDCIPILKRKFEEEKEAIFAENIIDYTQKNTESFLNQAKTKEIIYFSSIVLEIISFVLFTIHLFIGVSSKWMSTIFLILSLSIFFVNKISIAKLDKLWSDKDFEEQYIKTLTRNLDFAEKLRFKTWKA